MKITNPTIRSTKEAPTIGHAARGDVRREWEEGEGPGGAGRGDGRLGSAAECERCVGFGGRLVHRRARRGSTAGGVGLVVPRYGLQRHSSLGGRLEPMLGPVSHELVQDSNESRGQVGAEIGDRDWASHGPVV